MPCPPNHLQFIHCSSQSTLLSIHLIFLSSFTLNSIWLACGATGQTKLAKVGSLYIFYYWKQFSRYELCISFGVESRESTSHTFPFFRVVFGYPLCCHLCFNGLGEYLPSSPCRESIPL